MLRWGCHRVRVRLPAQPQEGRAVGGEKREVAKSVGPAWVGRASLGGLRDKHGSDNFPKQGRIDGEDKSANRYRQGGWLDREKVVGRLRWTLQGGQRGWRRLGDSLVVDTRRFGRKIRTAGQRQQAKLRCKMPTAVQMAIATVDRRNYFREQEDTVQENFLRMAEAESRHRYERGEVERRRHCEVAEAESKHRCERGEVERRHHCEAAEAESRHRCERGEVEHRHHCETAEAGSKHRCARGEVGSKHCLREEQSILRGKKRKG